MQIDRHIQRIFRGGNAGDVIEVRVREQHVLDVQVEVADGPEQLVDLVAGIDETPSCVRSHATTNPFL